MVQPIDPNRFLSPRQPHIHEQQRRARDMVRVEVGQNQVVNIIDGNPSLLQPLARRPGTINQDNASIMDQGQLCIRVLAISHGAGGP